ncbi:hypothetical protein D3C84_982010 [compost metagenome]
MRIGFAIHQGVITVELIDQALNSFFNSHAFKGVCQKWRFRLTMDMHLAQHVFMAVADVQGLVEFKIGEGIDVVAETAHQPCFVPVQRMIELGFPCT